MANIEFDQTLLNRFGLVGSPQELNGGTRKTYRVGDYVFKQITETSLENNRSPELAVWVASVFENLNPTGFRIPKSRKTVDGKYITEDGWTAWDFMEGINPSAGDIPKCIEATYKFHHVLSDVAKNSILDENITVFGIAHAHCFQEIPGDLNPVLRSHIEKLYSLKEPIPEVRSQLIHGDLNPENILITDGLAPAFIDMTPFWAPVDFAIAMFANWVGPRKGNMELLKYFENTPNFKQNLVRAGIRMLLIMTNVDDWETCSEKKASEIII